MRRPGDRNTAIIDAVTGGQVRAYWYRSALRWIGLVLVSLGGAIVALVGALALWYRLPFQQLGNLLCAIGWAGAGGLALWRVWRVRDRRALMAYAIATAGLLVWWTGIAPSDQRVWADDVARHVVGRVDGEFVTLENVRNFDWRSDTDYTARWETRRYALSALRSVDVGSSYWMGPAIAHTLVSFGFDDGRGGREYLAFSVEIRKERGESFSALAGFFKQYELALVAADERDLLAVRTNVRDEDLYLYNITMSPAAMRSLLLAYVDQAAQLRKAPRFYNTLTANCTTLIFDMARRMTPGIPLDWRLLASGYLPEYLHSIGALAPGMDIATLRQAGRITQRARADGASAQFSRSIRAGLPLATVKD